MLYIIIKVEWELEGGLYPNKGAEVDQVGRGLETPGWGEDYPGSFVSWWAESHTYKASLLTEGAMEMMEENDTLVVELTAEIWGGELFVGRGGQSPSDMIEKRHVLHKEELTWAGAEQVREVFIISSWL